MFSLIFTIVEYRLLHDNRSVAAPISSNYKPEICSACYTYVRGSSFLVVVFCVPLKCEAKKKYDRYRIYERCYFGDRIS